MACIDMSNDYWGSQKFWVTKGFCDICGKKKDRCVELVEEVPYEAPSFYACSSCLFGIAKQLKEMEE